MRGAQEIAIPVRWRPVLAGASAAMVVAAVVVAYALVQPGRSSGPEVPVGSIVVPVGYEIADDPPPAADHLRDLAARITDAPYDGQIGAYIYHRIRTWGGVQLVTEEGHEAGFVSEIERWGHPDGSMRVRVTHLESELSDEDARRYWEEENGSSYVSSIPDGLSAIRELYVVPGEPIPTDPEQRIAGMIGVDPGGLPGFGAITQVYETHLVPRDHRAAILEVLAEVPGVMWRGEVTDRAGRQGVAVTYDRIIANQGVQAVLVFDPDTGELLATEVLWLGYPAEPPLADYYMLLLDAGRTDDPGPEPTTR